MMPKNVSLLFIETLNALQQKRAEQKTYNVTMENRLNFEKEKLNTAVGRKRLRQTQIDELVLKKLEIYQTSRTILRWNYSPQKTNQTN